MNRVLTILGAFWVLSLSIGAIAQENASSNAVEVSENWKTLFIQDDIQVEYKVQECNNLQVRNQVLVLFRITNTSDTEIKTMNWSVEEYRNNVCSNCDRLDGQEFLRSVTLSPEESIEGDGTSTADNRVYLFGNFIELVPGMSNQKLTDFKFVNVEVINQGTQK